MPNAHISRFSNVVVTSLSLSSMLACAPSGPTPGGPAREWFEARRHKSEVVCMCWEMLEGYTSEAECVTDLDTFGPRIEDCHVEIYDKLDESDAAISCLTEAERDYSTCLMDVSCDELASDGEACAMAYDAAKNACPHIPHDAEDEVNDKCFADVSPFTCDDGQEIPMSHTCDSHPDCNDGSDESQC